MAREKKVEFSVSSAPFALTPASSPNTETRTETPSARLRRFRKMAGMTQLALARLSGLTQSRIATFENEYRNLRAAEIATCERCCKQVIEKNARLIRIELRKK